MKCICITGAVQFDLKIIEEVLQKSGMAEPKLVQHDTSIDIDFLHNQCAAVINHEMTVDENERPNLGRFVEKLASDIFMANVNSSLWGWADNRSTQLLDFWRDYDPRLYFILVCVSPEQMLANSMSSIEETSTFEEIMESWQKYHQQLLRFHLRNPQRSILIDTTDFFRNPNLFISYIAKHWNIKIALGSDFKLPVLPKDDYLLFLAQQLCIDNRKIVSLQNELKASCLVFDEDNSVNFSADKILFSYQAAQKRTSELVLEQQAQIEQLITKNAENSELLLLELHQAHQESEHYFEQFLNKQKDFEHSQARWQRMLQRNPEHCDYESLLIKAIAKNSILWQFRNLNTAYRTISAFDFEVKITPNHTVFVFYRLSEKQDTFEIVFANNGTVQKNSIEVLSKLATSDWIFLISLIHLLQDILKQPSNLNLPADFSLDALHFGVNQFSLLLKQITPSVRYDKVVLKREQVNPDYEHLWLKLMNLSFGSRHDESFEFRLSCANVRPNVFGGYPKLEFPEDVASQSFENWFEESYDDFGAKLELRFALPDAMDISIWEQLSERDQEFVAEIIRLLPKILNELKQANVKIKRSWEDWLQMSENIAQIYAMRVLPMSIISHTKDDLDKSTNSIDKIIAELWDDLSIEDEVV